MVEYVTRAELIEIGKTRLTESLAKVAKAESRSAQNTTFLSHSSKDDDAMPGVVLILENHGATVYLDKKDPTLSTKPPPDIAKTLRGHISQAKKFVLFASNNTKESKWVPWELGLADGYKKPRNVCIFPGPDKSEDRKWMEQEYLGIYDRVVWGAFKGQEQSQWMVWDHVENSAIRLREWLERP